MVRPLRKPHRPPQLHSSTFTPQSTQHQQSIWHRSIVHFEVEFCPPYLLPQPLIHTIDARVGLNMEVGASSSSHDASNWTSPQGNVSVKGKGSTRRQPRDSKPKQSPNPPGTRYQCPRCPKNFSRIENLTRHQANRTFCRGGGGRVEADLWCR